MASRRRISVMAPLAAAAFGVVAASANADVRLESTPCVVTLAPSYSADAFGSLVQEIPTSAVQCPGFSVEGISLTVTFTAPGGQRANFANKHSDIYDPVTNTIVNRPWFLELIPQGDATYTAVAPIALGNNYITNPATQKNYPVVLARPFTVTSTSPATPSCTLNLNPSYGYVWNQEQYFVVPDSAISCNGFAFDSGTYDANMNFSSKVLGAGRLFVAQRTVFNPGSGTFTTINELRLTSYTAEGKFLNARDNGLATPAGSPGWTWGRFTQGVEGAQVTSRSVQPDGQQTPIYRLTLAKPFAIKRATTVTATGRRTSAGVTVKIHADRNWSFQNSATPTLRRQPVVPTAPGDRPVIKRDGKVIARPVLNNFGYATVTLPPVRGRHTYTVVMKQTDNNLAGSATFKA